MLKVITNILGDQYLRTHDKMLELFMSAYDLEMHLRWVLIILLKLAYILAVTRFAEVTC